jgi:hypothetical protein
VQTLRVRAVRQPVHGSFDMSVVSGLQALHGNVVSLVRGELDAVEPHRCSDFTLLFSMPDYQGQ